MTMTIRFLFKNGHHVDMKCTDFVAKFGIDGNMVGYNAKGITENKIIDIDLNELVCVFRLLSDEKVEDK